MNKKSTIFVTLCAFAFIFTSCTNLTASLSDKKIESFYITDTNTYGTINEAEHTITLALPSSTNVSALRPVIKVSDGATVSPASNSFVDLTNPVVYTVTAGNGSIQTYTVSVGSSSANIKIFPGTIGTAASTVKEDYTIFKVPAGEPQKYKIRLEQDVAYGFEVADYDTPNTSILAGLSPTNAYAIIEIYDETNNLLAQEGGSDVSAFILCQKTGTYEILVSNPFGNEAYYGLHVFTKISSEKHTNSITIDRKKYEVATGLNITLKANYTPIDSVDIVNWTSSNSSIIRTQITTNTPGASTWTGKAFDPGTAEVYASSNYYGNIRDYCTVTVKGPASPVKLPIGTAKSDNATDYKKGTIEPKSRLFYSVDLVKDMGYKFEIAQVYNHQSVLAGVTGDITFQYACIYNSDYSECLTSSNSSDLVFTPTEDGTYIIMLRSTYYDYANKIASGVHVYSFAPITSIVFDQESVVLNNNETATVTATVMPAVTDDKIIVSMDPYVARVYQSGKIGNKIQYTISCGESTTGDRPSVLGVGEIQLANSNGTVVAKCKVTHTASSIKEITVGSAESSNIADYVENYSGSTGYGQSIYKVNLSKEKTYHVQWAESYGVTWGLCSAATNTAYNGLLANYGASSGDDGIIFIYNKDWSCIMTQDDGDFTFTPFDTGTYYVILTSRDNNSPNSYVAAYFWQ